MKREILFRGKRKNGQWVYGSLVVSEGIDPAIYYEVRNKLIIQFDWCYVNPETIGQYTGLKDKNGIKIFEGDIIESNGYKHLVKYNENLAGFCAVNVKHPEDLCGINQQWINECSKVVIGNVTDNPEMVKGCSNEE